MDEAFIIKYLSENCTEEEKREVEQWMAESEANAQYFESIKKIWSVDPKEEFHPNALKAWDRVQYRISEIDEHSMDQNVGPLHRYGSRNKARKKRQIHSVLYTIAAVFLVVIGVLFVMDNSLMSAGNGELVDNIAEREIVTENGQRTTFSLSDGSRVILNAASKVTIPANFSAGNRELYLEGEAYFEVQSDKDHPFIVYSKGTFTRVLGTKFTISAHAKDGKVLAIVEEGRVAFGSQNTPNSEFEELTKNEIGEVHDDGSSRVYYKENLDEYVGWKDGKLIFNDAPFDEVITKLERWYNIDIGIPDSTEVNRNLTASFNNEPMTEVLNIVALTLHITYKKDGRNVEFNK